MIELQQFISDYRPRLLAFAEMDTRIPGNGSPVLDFVNEVLDQWSIRFSEVNLPKIDRREMTFWFCLYDIESLAEIPPNRPLDPFEVHMIEQLRSVRVLLRCHQPLPRSLYATRPDGVIQIVDDGRRVSTQPVDGLPVQSPG